MKIGRLFRAPVSSHVAGRVPRLAIELLIGLALGAGLAIARVALLPVIASKTPFALVFVSITWPPYLQAGVRAWPRSPVAKH